MNEDNKREGTGSGSQSANEESVVSSVLSNIRQIFDRSAEKEASGASAGRPTIIIRNCSTKAVLMALLDDLGDGGHASGRYFIPRCQDLPRIREMAEARDLFVKESTLGSVTILDLMVDRTKHPLGDR